MWRVVLRDGIEAATTREVSREAGCSTGVLQHYFTGKDELLVAALRLSHEAIADRFERTIEAQSPVNALRAYLHDTLPLDEGRYDETHLDISFLSRALVSDELREVQQRTFSRWRSRLMQLLDVAVEAGDLEAGDSGDRADSLIGLVLGLGVESLLNKSLLPPERLVHLLDAQLDCWKPRRRGR